MARCGGNIASDIATDRRPFDPNDVEHQAFRTVAETIVGIDLDPAIDLTDSVTESA